MQTRMFSLTLPAPRRLREKMAKQSRKRRYTLAQKAMFVAGILIIASMVLSGVAVVFQPSF